VGSDDNDIKALDALYEQVGAYRKGTDLKGLFDFLKRFPRVAPYNAFLLHVQKPGSRYVASAKEWNERFGRSIKPGARPLVILWPFAPVHFVFELADTEGGAPFPDELLNPFKMGGKLRPGAVSILKLNLARDGVSYNEADRGTESAGMIQMSVPSRNQRVGKAVVRVLYNLVVNSNHSDEEKFATVVHELAHLYCGHLGTPNDKWWPDRRGLEKNSMEFEAESVAWLICERVGITNPSAKYLAGYLDKEAETPPISLEAVIKAAGMIETMTQRRLGLRKELILETDNSSASPAQDDSPFDEEGVRA
jgi:hypothetical protein